MPRTMPPHQGEFRREAIRLLLLATRRTVRWQRIWGFPTSTSRNWLKQERAARGERPGGLSGDEGEELNRLGDENAKLRMKRESLAKEAVFAKEGDGR